MTRRYAIWSWRFIVTLLFIALLLRVVDKSMEVDSLKDEIVLRGDVVTYLLAVSKQSLTACGLKASELGKISTEARYPPLAWQGSTTRAGPFEFGKSGECIVSIKLLGNI